MKKSSTLIVIALSLLLLSTIAPAKDKSNSDLLTGTWECMSHGSPQGDLSFTLYLEQDKDAVTGSVSSPIGSADLTSATFKHKTLEIHIDTSQGNYLLNGIYKKGHLAGQWSTDSGLKGTWEGKKSSEAPNAK